MKTTMALQTISKYFFDFISLIAFAFAFSLTTNVLAESGKFSTGIAITPANFPTHTEQDLDEAFKLASELGKYSVFIFQWHELDLDVIRLMMSKSRDNGLVPILGISPTSLDQGRKELDIPDSVRQQAGSNISFSNPVIRNNYINDVKKLARLKPAYLCLATEINFLAIQRLDEYLHFASLYKDAYRKIKQISPHTKVFVSFQWEWVRIIDSREMDKIKEHSKVISIFKPELDLVGLTTYPSAFHNNPEQLPADYYSWIHHHIDHHDSVLIMEAGWPTAGSGTELEQKHYIQRLPELLGHVNTSILAWSLLHDVNLAEFDANLNTTGLLTGSGDRKPGFDAYQALDKATTKVRK